MNSKFLFFLLFSLNFAFSQDLYVADNSYLFANDVVVFVNDDIRLETPTSNLYFRGDAQLIQNTDTKNSDAGSLSIYQNQTTGIYEYNYWCSPVGLGTDGTQANADFLGGNNIYDPADDTNVANVNSSLYGFTSDYNGTASQLSSYWIYTLKDAEGYWDWNQVFDTGTIETGYGFTLKGSPNTDNVLDFRGRPNNGTITVSCSFDGVDDQPSGLPNHAETLTGNPYPSALDLKLFLAHADNQTNLNGAIYFWEQKQKNSHYLADYEGGYGVYIPGDIIPPYSDNGTYTIAPFESYNEDGSSNTNTSDNTTDFSGNNQRRYAAVGQGFVIASDVDGGFATFDNSMRVGFAQDSDPNGDGSVFAKGKKKKTESEGKKYPISHNGVNYKTIFENPTVVPEIRLHTHINNSYYKENVIAFRESTPNNSTYNKFFDGRNINDLASDVYLISGTEKLVIKSIKYDESVSLPLGFKVGKNNSLFSLKTHKLNNVPEHVNVYVYDRENNGYTDVKNGTFEITLNQGTYNDRFEITFSKNALNLPVISENNFKVFFNKSTSEITILNPEQVELKALTLFDISGKQIVNRKHLHSEKRHAISTKSLNVGTYLVNIETSDNHKITKKVVVHDIAK